MTKEEALKILDTIPTIGEQVDALEIAIEALKNPPSARRAAHPKIMPLICLRCKKDIPLTFDAFVEISYTHYSYCEDCLRQGLALLRANDKEENNEQCD